MMSRFDINAAHEPDMDHNPQDSRAHLRTGMLMTAPLRLADDEQADQVRIRNLSEQGLMAEIGRTVPMGTRLTVDLPGVGEVGGSVAWCAEGRIGVALDRPIDIALVNAARSAS